MKPSSDVVLFSPFSIYTKGPKGDHIFALVYLALGGKQTDSAAAALHSSRANAMLKDFSIS